MVSKSSFSLFVIGLFVAGLFVLFLPQNASAGSMVGCCITNGGQCSPSCGPMGSACQNEADDNENQCNGRIEVTPADCNTDDADCFVVDAFCFQQESSFAVCIDAPEGACCIDADCTEETEADCGGVYFGNFSECAEVTCSVPPTAPTCEGVDCDDGEICTDDTCDAGVCGAIFNEANDPSCAPAGPLTIIPTMGQWGMIIATILLGFFAVRMLRNRKDSEI